MPKKISLLILYIVFTLFVSAQHQPNILLILADDLGYGDLGCYGNPLIETPFLDKIASAGLKATNYIAASPSCTPSRYSLLTGKYATGSGLIFSFSSGKGPGLSNREMTIAKLLKMNGYATGLIGKWHLGDQFYAHPNSHGFDFFYGMLYSNDYKQPYNEEDSILKIFRQRTPEIIQPDDSSLTQLYTHEAIDFIKSQKDDQPFFLYLAHSMPHFPIAASYQYRNTVQAGLYGDVLREMDSTISSIWKIIEERGMANNTIFIFTSDNGPRIHYPERRETEEDTAHGNRGTSGIFRGGKGECYEGGHRVPFILYWKNHVPQGFIVTDPISCIDVLPTLAAFTHSVIPDTIFTDGISVANLLTGIVPALPDRPLYYIRGGEAEGVRLNAWKLLRNTPASADSMKTLTELYNLNLDPSEHINVADANPDKTKELIDLLDQYSDKAGRRK